MTFNEKYENNIINWSGYFAEVKSKQQSGFNLFDNDHHLSILVKMSPSESQIFADLVLSVSSSFYRENKKMLDALKKGDGIDFEAVLVGQGTEFKMHHLHAKNINKNNTFKQLSEIVVRESSLPWLIAKLKFVKLIIINNGRFYCYSHRHHQRRKKYVI